MKNAMIAACIILTLPLAAGADTKHAPSSRPMGVVTVEMPGDLHFNFKQGPGMTLVASSCLTCHSSAYVSSQPRLDKEHWLGEVNKMRKVYGAQISDADTEKIAAYLTTEYGKPTL